MRYNKKYKLCEYKIIIFASNASSISLHFARYLFIFIKISGKLDIELELKDIQST